MNAFRCRHGEDLQVIGICVAEIGIGIRLDDHAGAAIAPVDCGKCFREGLEYPLRIVIDPGGGRDAAGGLRRLGGARRPLGAIGGRKPNVVRLFGADFFSH